MQNNKEIRLTIKNIKQLFCMLHTTLFMSTLVFIKTNIIYSGRHFGDILLLLMFQDRRKTL